MRRALALLLLALMPLFAAGDHAAHAARDATYDDTTTGAIAHPEVVFAAGSAPMQLAQQIAKARWGTDPCGGQVDIVWSQLEPDINAQSTWTNPRSPYDDPALNGDCQVTFNAIASFDWPTFCTVAMHEYGHLSGRPHSPDPDDVMAAYYTRPAPECVAQTPAQFRPAPPRHAYRRARHRHRRWTRARRRSR